MDLQDHQVHVEIEDHQDHREYKDLLDQMVRMEDKVHQEV